MRVDQFHPEIREGDAVGNEVLALSGMLKARGVQSEIFCEVADPAFASKVHLWREYAGRAGDFLVVHYSHASRLYRQVFACRARRVLRYHNVTPAHYLTGLREGLADGSEEARAALPLYANSVALALADSTFNARDLKKMGFRDVVVFPYVLNESLYSEAGDSRDEWTNIISVGRIFPQKHVEDCILIFDYFRKFIEAKSRLLLIGGWEGAEAYLARLKRLVNRLNVPNVIFTGRIPQPSLLANYTAADVLLSMSEHEGFCVPLVEGMRQNIPVIAFDAGAVAETMGDAGVLVREKRWPEIAEAIGILLSVPDWREHLIAGQRERVKFFSGEEAERRLDGVLTRFR
ncbi:MAG: glycosyltransferase [Acidobacteriota bacterium]|nr:glycosyltransferase [Acidobacteriota bacterium]